MLILDEDNAYRLVWSQFCLLRKRGIVKMAIQTDRIPVLAAHLDAPDHFAHRFWTTIWLLSFPGVVTLVVTEHYAWAAAVLLLITFGMWNAPNKAAMNAIEEKATRDPAFFSRLVSMKAVAFCISHKDASVENPSAGLLTL